MNLDFILDADMQQYYYHILIPKIHLLFKTAKPGALIGKSKSGNTLGKLLTYCWARILNMSAIFSSLNLYLETKLSLKLRLVENMLRASWLCGARPVRDIQN